MNSENFCLKQSSFLILEFIVEFFSFNILDSLLNSLCSNLSSNPREFKLVWGNIDEHLFSYFNIRSLLLCIFKFDLSIFILKLLYYKQCLIDTYSSIIFDIYNNFCFSKLRIIPLESRLDTISDYFEHLIRIELVFFDQMHHCNLYTFSIELHGFYFRL